MALPPFQTALDEHRDTVARFLVATVGAQEADDCLQETLISALRAYPRLRPDSNIRAWLLTIARNKALDAHRSRGRRPVPVAEPDPGATGAIATAPGESDADLCVAQTPRGLARIAYLDFTSHDRVLNDMAARLSPRMLEAPGRLDEARRELDDYFAGRRRDFELAIDWTLVGPFGRRVLGHT